MSLREYQGPIGAPEEMYTLEVIQSFVANQENIVARAMGWINYPIMSNRELLRDSLNQSRDVFGETAEHFLGREDMKPEEKALSVIGLIRLADRIQVDGFNGIDLRARLDQKWIHDYDINTNKNALLTDITAGIEIPYIVAGATGVYSVNTTKNINGLSSTLNGTRRLKKAQNYDAAQLLVEKYGRWAALGSVTAAAGYLAINHFARKQ